VKQEQEGGDGSTNNQAGRDIVHVTNYHYSGLTEERLQELAQQQEQFAIELFAKNAPRLVQSARDEFDNRAIEVTREVIKEVIAENPENLERFGQSRAQVQLLKAQESFGETGNRETVPHLARLVAQLVASTPQSYTEMISRRCVNSLINMTSSHLNLIAVVSMLQRKWFPNAVALEMLVSGLNHSLAPYIGKIPTKGIEYSYIHSLGVADENALGLFASAIAGVTNQTNQYNPYNSLRTSNPNTMYEGFSIAELPELAQSLDPDKYFLHDPNDPEVMFLAPDFAGTWFKLAKNYSDKPSRPSDPAEAALITFCEGRLFAPDEVKRRIRALDAPLADLLDTLEEFNALALNLNPVGLMLVAHEETIRNGGQRSDLFDHLEIPHTEVDPLPIVEVE
jgi:hypothetical protein